MKAACFMTLEEALQSSVKEEKSYRCTATLPYFAKFIELKAEPALINESSSEKAANMEPPEFSSSLFAIRPSTNEVDGILTSSDEADLALGKSSADERWESMYQRLVLYKQQFGHSNVPSRYPEDPQLGFWVSTQRRQYRKADTPSGKCYAESTLNPERKRKLDELGFQWSAKDPNSIPWEKRFEQLKLFVEKYGHALVPIKWKENPQLASWVSRQRQEYRQRSKGMPSRLTDERLEQLNGIGFVWEPKRGAPRRDETLQEQPAPARLQQHDSSPFLARHLVSSSSGQYILGNQFVHPVGSQSVSTSNRSGIAASPAVLDVLSREIATLNRTSAILASSAASSAYRNDLLHSVSSRGRASLSGMNCFHTGEVFATLPSPGMIPLSRIESPSLRDRLLHAALNDSICRRVAEGIRNESIERLLPALPTMSSNSAVNPSTRTSEVLRPSDTEALLRQLRNGNTFRQFFR